MLILSQTGESGTDLAILFEKPLSWAFGACSELFGFLGGAGAAFAKSRLRDYNLGMKQSSSDRKTFQAAYRLVALLLVTALMLSHPVPARDLHYCSFAGELMSPGRACSALAGSCCAVQPPDCCRKSAEKTGSPSSCPAIASPGCSDCCREYSLAEINPLIAEFTAAAEDIEVALRDLPAGAVVRMASTAREICSSRSIGPSDLPSGLPIYLLSCRFLI